MLDFEAGRPLPLSDPLFLYPEFDLNFEIQIAIEI